MKRIGWLELFILVISLLNGVLLFPGTQPLRFLIRAAPFAASLAAFFFTRSRRRSLLPPGGIALEFILLLLVLNLFHPATQLRAGVAQIVFQLAIFAPAFWAADHVRDDQRLVRLLGILFACNLLGSVVGLLQIYFPEHFLPAEFSAEASASWLNSLTFISPSGRILVRPPGLSDLPGGAAMAGSLAAMLGFAFSSQRSLNLWLRAGSFAGAIAGVAVLYLTQVRSLTLMTVAAIVLLACFGIARGRTWSRGWMAGASILLIFGSFTWAVAAGGEKVRDRFLNISGDGVMETYDTSRGWFWRYTFGEALEKYPLGAGLGRWGMMSVYFGDANRPDSPSLWAEIQPTGWLYDGGVPLWLLQAAALLASMLFLARIAFSNRYGDSVPFAATLVFCMNANIIGASLSGPAFNTSMGLQYWLFLALVCGAARGSWSGPSPAQIRLGVPLLAPAHS